MKKRTPHVAGPARPPVCHRFGLLAVMFLGVAWAGAVFGQMPVEPREVPGGVSPRLKFNDAPLSMVLEEYSEVTGRTLLKAPGLPTVKITIQGQSELTNAEYLQAIETVLNMHGIAIVRVGDKFAKIVSSKAFLQEAETFIPEVQGKPIPNTGELVSQMILLKNIEIAEAMAAIKPLQHSAFGNLSAFERIGGVLVTDTASNVNRIIRIIGYIDQPVELREEVKIFDIEYAKPSEIKRKLEEIIAESQKEEQKKKSTVQRPRMSGSPGVRTSRTIPGLIRAPRKGAVRTSTPVADLIESAERGLIRGKVHMVADDRTKVLIVITRQENFKFFEKIIQVLDKGTDPDVLVQIIRLEYADAEAVAATLNTLIGQDKGKDEARVARKGTDKTEEGRSTGLREYVERLRTEGPQKETVSKVGQLSAANIKILPDKRTNSLLLMASKADFAAIRKIVSIMDMQLSQVLIEAVIIQVELGDTLESGVHWVQNAVVLNEGVKDGVRGPQSAIAAAGGGGGAPVNASTLTAPGAWSSPAGLSLYFTHFGLSLDAIVKLVETDSRTQILSAPVIVTTDNTEATLTSSQQRYFLKGSTVDQFGNVRPQTEIKDIGLTLKVTPHINQNKNVMMEIEQDISDLGPEQSIEGQGTWPTTTKRTFTASIAVRDRETIVLGGLVRNSKTLSRSKVPLLGDIPLIGLLFRSDNSDKARSEVVAFITPYVMDTPEEIARESVRRKEALNVRGLWERGWSDSELSDESRNERSRKKTDEPAGKPTPGPAAPSAVRPVAVDHESPDLDRLELDFINEVEEQRAP